MAARLAAAGAGSEAEGAEEVEEIIADEGNLPRMEASLAGERIDRLGDRIIGQWEDPFPLAPLEGKPKNRSLRLNPDEGDRFHLEIQAVFSDEVLDLPLSLSLDCRDLVLRFFALRVFGGLPRGDLHGFLDEGLVVAVNPSDIALEPPLQAFDEIAEGLPRHLGSRPEEGIDHLSGNRGLPYLRGRRRVEWVEPFGLEGPDGEVALIDQVFPVGMREKKMILGITSFVPTIWRAADVCCGKEGECAHPGGGGASI